MPYYILKNDKSEAMGNQNRAKNNNLTKEINCFLILVPLISNVWF